MGAVLGLLFGVGLILIWSSFQSPTSEPRPRGTSRIRPLLAGENISARFVVPTVASSVDLVVHLGLDNAGARRVNEIVAVPGRVENDIVETEPVFARTGGDLVHTGGMPTRLETFERAGIDVHRILRSAD